MSKNKGIHIKLLQKGIYRWYLIKEFIIKHNANELEERSKFANLMVPAGVTSEKG